VPTALGQLIVQLGRSTQPDLGLLRQFVQSADDEAFAELVSRHGPMVLALCRRIVRDCHLAEDAFQAVFIVLARKAAQLKKDQPLGPWLYGVAYRTALGALAMRQRQLKSDRQANPVSEGYTTNEPDDATAVLDEEIARLSENYRHAVILCEMQGLPRAAAAKQLGIPEGTLSYRLATARKMLAKRLVERGIVLGTALGTAAALTKDLVASTVALSTGKLLLSAQLVQLVHGATHMALLSKLKLVTVAVAFCCLLGAGGLGLWQTEASNKTVPTSANVAPLPKQKHNLHKDYPHAVGTKWVYEKAVAGEANLKRLTIREVTDVRTEGDSTWVTIRQSYGFDPDMDTQKNVSHELVYRWTTEGLDAVSWSGRGFRDSLRVSRPDMAEGDDWPLFPTRTDGDSVTVHVGKAEKVTVPAGEYLAMPLTWEQSRVSLTHIELEKIDYIGLRPDGSSRQFYVEGIGLVMSGGYELRSFTPGKPAGQQIKAPLPKLRGKPTEVWGDAKGGLQAGLRMPAGLTVEYGEVGDLQLVVRNVGKDPASLQFWKRVGPFNRFEGNLYWRGGQDKPYVLEFDTLLSARPPKETSHQVEPGEEIVLWHIGIRNSVNNGVPPKDVYSEQLFPIGLHRLQAPKIGPETNGERLSTGELEVECLDEKSKISAPMPKLNEWKEAEPITFADGGRITSVEFAPSGKTFAVCRNNGMIDFYDPLTRKHQQSMNFLDDAKTNPKRQGGTIPRIAFRNRPHAKLGDVFAITHKNGVNFGTTGNGLLPDAHQAINDLPANWLVPDFDPHQVIWVGDGVVCTNGEEVRYRDFKGQETTYKGWTEFKDDYIPGWKLKHFPCLLAAVPGKTAWLMQFDNKNQPNGTKDFWYWNPDDSSDCHLMTGCRYLPACGTVSSDGQRIIVGDGSYDAVWLWDGTTYKKVGPVGRSGSGGQTAVAITPDGKSVAVTAPRISPNSKSGFDGTYSSELQVTIYSIPEIAGLTDSNPAKLLDWNPENRLPGNEVVLSLSFSPDGKTLLAAFGDPFSADNALYKSIPASMGIKVWTLGDPKDKAKPLPKADKEGVFVVSKLSYKAVDKALEVVDTSGKSLGSMPVGDVQFVRPTVSPDGQRLAYVGSPRTSNDQVPRNYHEPQDVFVVDLPLTEPPTKPTFQNVLCPRLAWAPDGRSLYLSRIADGTDVSNANVSGKVLLRNTVRYDLATKTETEVRLPDGHEVQDVSPDGKTLLTGVTVWNDGRTTYSSYLVPLDTLQPKRLGDADDPFMSARFSPDGARIVSIQKSFATGKEAGLYVAEVADGKFVKLPKEVGVPKECWDATWAPDGKRLAVLWVKTLRPPTEPPRRGPVPDLGPEVEWRVTVVDMSGAKPKAVREFPLSDQNVRAIEWADPKLAEPTKKDEPKPEPTSDVPPPQQLAQAAGSSFRLLPVEEKDGVLSWSQQVVTNKVVPKMLSVTEGNETKTITVNELVTTTEQKKIEAKVADFQLTCTDGQAVLKEDFSKRLKASGTLVLLYTPLDERTRKFFSGETLFAKLPGTARPNVNTGIYLLHEDSSNPVLLVDVKAKDGVLTWTDIIRTGKVETVIENGAPVTRQTESKEKTVTSEAKLADLTITDVAGKTMAAADIEKQFKDGGVLVRTASILSKKDRHLFQAGTLFLEPPVNEKPQAAKKLSDAAAFAKEFLADTEFTKKFDHPIWVRWAKVVGDDKCSRELFAELLGAEGALETLNDLHAEPKRADEIGAKALKKIADLRDAREKLRPQVYSGPGPRMHSAGESAFAVYLCTWMTEVDAKLPPRIGALQWPGSWGLGPTGAWDAEKGFGRGNFAWRWSKSFDQAQSRLFIESQMRVKNPNAICDLLTRYSHDPTRTWDPHASLLPLAQLACRQKEFSSGIRACGWLHVAKAGEIEYLPEIVKCQEDSQLIQKFSKGTSTGSYRMTVLVSDVSLVAQLVYHKQKPWDFGYFATDADGRDTDFGFNVMSYGFPDEDSRNAAHAKALEFLKTAKPLKANPVNKQTKEPRK
jgi:RNA polymerase sigma factor (sigma-70 family)